MSDYKKCEKCNQKNETVVLTEIDGVEGYLCLLCEQRALKRLNELLFSANKSLRNVISQQQQQIQSQDKTYKNLLSSLDHYLEAEKTSTNFEKFEKEVKHAKKEIAEKHHGSTKV